MLTRVRFISIGITSMFCLVFGNMLQSQNVAINSTGAAPNASAMLDVSGSEVGILIPRMTQANRPGAPENSLLIYQTDNDPGYYYYDATIPAWVKFMNDNDGNDKWDLEGNTGTNPTNNFVGTSDNQSLAFRTNNTERMRILNSGNVGVGTDAPAYRLHATGDIYANGGWFRVSGNNGLFFQTHGGGFRMTDATWIRTHGNKNFYHNTGIMRTDGQFHVGPGGNRMIVQGGGNVGINTTAPVARLHVSHNTNTIAAQFNEITVGNSDWAAGEFYNPNTGNGTGVLGTGFYGVYGDVTTTAGWSGFFTWDTYVDWLFYQEATQVSDKRLKDNITLIEDNRDLIKKLTPVSYTKKRNSFKTDINSTTENNRTDNHSFVEYGFIAQDVEKIFPELVKEKEMNVEGQGLLDVKGVNYIGLIPILTKAIQEQQEEIEDLEQRVEKLERLVNEQMKK